MVRHLTTALVAAFVFASAGIASAQAAQRFDGWTYPHSQQQFCYMPSSPCDNNHRVTN